MRVPTIHINGTSAVALSEAYEAAYRILGTAIEVVQQTLPNARDYYPQGDTAYVDARDEHRARMEKLVAIRNDMLTLFLAVDEGGAPRTGRVMMAATTTTMKPCVLSVMKPQHDFEGGLIESERALVRPQDYEE